MPEPVKIFKFGKPSFQIISLQFEKFSVTCIYSASNNKTEIMDEIITKITDNIDFNKPILICGDFNIPFNKNPQNHFSEKLINKGLEQFVKEPTHLEGNILDHLYSNCKDNFTYLTHPLYFSDHNALLSILPITENM